ncbi:MAG: pseudaminic acid synthase [Sphingosinicella sp.]
MSQAEIIIGPHRVGAGHPPFIIAELSANHGGSLELAMEILHAAADNGAHAIKLQTFTAATLSIDSHRPDFFIDDPESLWHGRRLWELYEEAETPWQWHAPLFEAARARGMACISSAFDQSSLDFLVGLGVDAIKIASFELVHIPLIEGAAKTGLPVILSTGMAAIAEIEDAVAALRDNGCQRFVLLRCTSAYPSEEKDANVVSIVDLRERFDCQVGLSDHCLSPYSVYAAVGLGATMIEKHLTMRRADGGLDAAFSMEPADLKETVEGSRRVWLSRGSVRYGTQAVEQTSRKERPSIYVTRPIAAGETFTPDNIRVIRPGFGLPPKEYRRILGRRAASDIEAESPLTWSLIADN